MQEQSPYLRSQLVTTTSTHYLRSLKLYLPCQPVRPCSQLRKPHVCRWGSAVLVGTIARSPEQSGSNRRPPIPLKHNRKIQFVVQPKASANRYTSHFRNQCAMLISKLSHDHHPRRIRRGTPQAEHIFGADKECYNIIGLMF